MAKINLILDTRRVKRDGSAPLKLDVAHGKHKYISIGMSVRPEDWNPLTQRLHPESPNAARLNNHLSRLFLRAEDAFLAITLSDEEYTMEDLVAAVEQSLGKTPKVEKPKTPLLLEGIERFLDTKAKGKTRRIYTTTLMHVRRYVESGASEKWEDMTRSWLLGFEAMLSVTAKSPNARAVYLRNLRAVCNFAIDEGWTAHYPFRKFHIEKTETAKRSLSVEQLRRLFTAEVEPWQERHRDYYMLTFFLIGINAVDLLGADISLHGDRIEYNRSKTGRLYSIKVEPEAQVLLDKYKGARKLLTWGEVYSNHEDFVKRATLAVRSIGKTTRSGRGGKKKVEAEFPGITSYWMRHSWATIAASLDIPKDTIAAALGHGGNTVTDIYIDFDRRKIDEANRRVIDWVLYGK